MAPEPPPSALVRNPDEPAHCMQIRPIRGRVTVALAGMALGDTRDAVHVLEFGTDFHDPVVYVPRADVVAPLVPSTAPATWCPLKGWAAYFDLVAHSGATVVTAAAWAYAEPVAGAEALADRLAFDSPCLSLEPAAAGAAASVGAGC